MSKGNAQFRAPLSGRAPEQSSSSDSDAGGGLSAALRSCLGSAARPGSWRVLVTLALVGLPLAATPALLLGQAYGEQAHDDARAVASLGSRGLPDAPQVPLPAGLQAAPQAAPPSLGPLSTMSGTVMDSIGEVVPGANVTLEGLFSGEKRSTFSDGNGYFSFVAVAPGTYRVAITTPGFANWAETDIPMQRGADLDLPHIVLKVASATTDVLVVFSEHQLAAEQVQIEEKQRVLGVIPNFYTSYVWHAAPLSVGQKFQLAWRSSIDPESFAASAAIAGVQQAQNDFRGYGQGAEGFAKRFGASYADGLIGTMIGGAALPALLHQDPRYFYKGTGTIRQRALYAIATTVICKGDNGRWQPNYSNLGGNLAAGALSNLYYPSDERNGAVTTLDNALIGTAAGAVGALIQEFLLRHITPGAGAHSKP